MELILVVAIIGIMAAIAIPAFMGLLPGMRLNGAARQLMGDLMDARMEAVKQNNEYKVFFLNDHQYQILDDDNNNGADDGETSRTVDIQDNFENVTFSATGNPVFSPKGVVKGVSTTTVTVQNSAGSKSISVSVAGRVKIQ